VVVFHPGSIFLGCFQWVAFRSLKRSARIPPLTTLPAAHALCVQWLDEEEWDDDQHSASARQPPLADVTPQELAAAIVRFMAGQCNASNQLSSGLCWCSDEGRGCLTPHAAHMLSTHGW